MLPALQLLSLFALGATAIPSKFDPNVSFVLVGDSTTNNDTVVDSGGWGNGFCASLVEGTPCINTAHDGATTGSFEASGLMNISLGFIRGEVAKGRRTLVTVQFGHNDQKIAPPESMGANLTEMVAQIRGAGGEPVLVTSLTRRNFFDNGTIDDVLQPWADEALLIAQEQHTHALDLHRYSLDYVQKIGANASHCLNRTPDDNTHLNVNGTTVFGTLVADLMAISYAGQLPITPDLKISSDLARGIPAFTC